MFKDLKFGSLIFFEVPVYHDECFCSACEGKNQNHLRQSFFKEGYKNFIFISILKTLKINYYGYYVKLFCLKKNIYVNRFILPRELKEYSNSFGNLKYNILF